MSLTYQSASPNPPTRSESESGASERVARVTLQVALLVEVVVDVLADDEDAARRAALESQARLIWDDISMAAARAYRTETVETSEPVAQGLTITRMTPGEAPELLIRYPGRAG
jgi:hypothetical protein